MAATFKAAKDKGGHGRDGEIHASLSPFHPPFLKHLLSIFLG